MKKIADYNVSLKIFLKNDKGEVLILKTPDHSSFHGSYDFPGGRIDEDEFYVDLLDILKREVIEEVGKIKFNIINNPVAVSRHRAQYKDHKEDIFYCFYEGNFLGGDLNVGFDGHTDYLWVNLSEIILEDYFESGMLDAVKIYLNN